MLIFRILLRPLTSGDHHHDTDEDTKTPTSSTKDGAPSTDTKAKSSKRKSSLVSTESSMSKYCHLTNFNRKHHQLRDNKGRFLSQDVHALRLSAL